MKTTKKLLAVALACVILLGIFPLSTFADASAETGVWVAGTNVSGDVETYWLNDGEGGLTSVGASASNYNVKYTPPIDHEAVLTLNNTSLSKWTEQENKACGIFANINSARLLVTLVGDNTVEVNPAEQSDLNGVYGIYTNYVLGINGDGKLNVRAFGDNAIAISGLKHSFEYMCSFNLDGKATVVAEGTYCGVDRSQTTISGKATLIAKGEIGISSPSFNALAVNGGKVEAIGTSRALDIKDSYSFKVDKEYDAQIKVNDEPTSKRAKKWDKENEEINSFKYVKIGPYPQPIAFFRNVGDAIREFIYDDVISVILGWIISLFV